jgi:hypothetical protein
VSECGNCSLFSVLCVQLCCVAGYVLCCVICMYVCTCNITAETNHKPAGSVTYSLDQLPSHMENYEVVSVYITK